MQASPELIELITKQVMECVKSANSCQESRPGLLVFGEPGSAACLSGRFAVKTADEKTERISLSDYEKILITRLDTELLTDLALGICRGKRAGAVSEALLLGKSVYIAEEGISFLQYRHTANARYYQLFVEYLKKLESFGMTVLPMEQISHLLSGKETCGEDTAEKEQKQSQTEKRSQIKGGGLFSADMARKYAAGGEKVLRVRKGTLLTPLAKDILREKKIELIYEK